jgi:hypothetical protein
VHFTLRGDSARIDELVARLQSGQELNSWGAAVGDTVLCS